MTGITHLWELVIPACGFLIPVGHYPCGSMTIPVGCHSSLEGHSTLGSFVPRSYSSLGSLIVLGVTHHPSGHSSSFGSLIILRVRNHSSLRSLIHPYNGTDLNEFSKTKSLNLLYHFASQHVYIYICINGRMWYDIYVYIYIFYLTYFPK